MAVQAGEHQAHTSATVFVNVHYLLRKTLGKQRALTLLRKLKLLVTVVPTSDEAINRSLSSDFSDYEDAVQYYTALEHHMDALVTRNKKDYKHAVLRVLSAEEVVAKVSDNAGFDYTKPPAQRDLRETPRAPPPDAPPRTRR